MAHVRYRTSRNHVYDHVASYLLIQRLSFSAVHETASIAESTLEPDHIINIPIKNQPAKSRAEILLND
jgi:hypothetical protein